MLNMSHGRTSGVMTENMSLIRQNDLDLWHASTQSQQKTSFAVSHKHERDWEETEATTEDSPWHVFPSSFSLRPGGHLQ